MPLFFSPLLRIILPLTAILLVAGSPSGFTAQAKKAADSGAIPRKLLVFWDSSEHEVNDKVFSRTHKKLEVVLNHLGYMAEYIDVNQPKTASVYQKNLPADYLGVIHWLTDSRMLHARAHLTWLRRQMQRGKKFIQLGEIGFLNDQNNAPLPTTQLQSLYQQMGLRYTGDYIFNPLLFELAPGTDKKNYEFERTLQGELRQIHGFESVQKENRSWLTVKIKGTKKRYSAIVTTPGGGLVQPGFAIHTNPSTFVTKWRIDPFRFLREALAQPVFPVPDTTTLCGRRIYYSHIDGDGFINISERDRKSYSAKVILDEVIKKHDLPVTVSYVVAEVDKRHLGNEVTEALAREISTQKNVEVSSHTYTHPLSWSEKITDFDRELYGQYIKSPDQKSILSYDVGIKNLSYQRETIESIQLVENKFSAQKPVRLLQWSGDCRPPQQALQLLAKQGFLNLNGGDSRFDSDHSSYSHLSPLYRMVGGHMQVYSSAANENLFTNLWQGPYGGFSWVVDFFKNTKSPVRVKPINVYYHFYSGEKIAALEALKIIFKWVQ